MSDESWKEPANIDGPGQLESNAAPSEGFPVEVEPDALAAAVDLLKRTHKYIDDDMLAQQVWGFIKAHGG